ncbi:hypothetical protein CBOM_04835 [Ceraceosorus bombacis]|uniref:Uncharacterized protein n=1 Tax=Ceraceosorus bombacis TaxID=401625 RepID=A0A0N7LB54_9BASI|nr:hypothetical protein CBOM_04835 [Ceraceosorus bombacis]
MQSLRGSQVNALPALESWSECGCYGRIHIWPDVMRQQRASGKLVRSVLGFRFRLALVIS